MPAKSLKAQIEASVESEDEANVWEMPLTPAQAQAQQARAIRGWGRLFGRLSFVLRGRSSREPDPVLGGRHSIQY